MKRLADVADRAELEGLRLLLESKGIPVFVGNEAGARNLGFISPARQQTLWVVFDEQLEDALAVMADPEHPVERPVDVDAYQRDAERVEAEARNRVFGMVMMVGVAAVLAAGGILYALVRYG